MIDGDPIGQWIIVPDDRPALPPVDEDIEICGLRDFSNFGVPTELHIDQNYSEPSGLLLADTFGPITLPHDAGRNVFPLTSDSPPSHIPSYASLFPPALSPDSSPTSVASSTPWLRTPGSDPPLADAVNVDALWDNVETKEEPSLITHFLDESGNNLEDIPSQVQDVMLEDIACTPQLICNASLPQISDVTPCGSMGPSTPLCSTPTLILSPPYASVSPAEVVPPAPPNCASLSPPSPHVPLFAFSPVTYRPRETPLPGYSSSLSLSPLSNISVFSQSPNAAPSPLPLADCSLLSPAISPVPLPNGENRVEAVDSVSLTFTGATLAKLRGKRSVGTLDDDLEAPPWKIPRRSKVRNVDDEEWNPGSARVRHPRVTTSSKYTGQTSTSTPSCPRDDSSGRETRQHSDATHTICEICGQGFTRSSDYVRHIENSASHPETRKVWPCPHCDSTLSRRDALGRHIKTMHPGRPAVDSKGISGSQFPESRKEPPVQRMGKRKMSIKRQPRENTGT